MKVYTVERQNKFDYDFSIELLKVGCFLDKAKAIELAKAEYESMQAEYEDQMLKYSDEDIYNPHEHDSGALYVEEDDECGFYFISFGNDEHYESHCVWVEEWDVTE